MSCSFRLCAIMAFLRNGILQTAQRVLGCGSGGLGLDALLGAGTGGPCIISDHSLVVRGFNV